MRRTDQRYRWCELVAQRQHPPQLQYIHAWLDKQPTGQTEADVFAVRAQIDFYDSTVLFTV